MKATRLAVLGMSGALLLSTAVQADAADSTVTSGQLLERSRLHAADYGRGLPTGDAVTQRNRVQGMQGVQDGSYNGTPLQTRQQTRTQEQSHNREHTYQGDSSGSRYGQGYESRGGNGGYGAGSSVSGHSRSGSGGSGSGSGGSGRSGGKGGGRR
jgi:hypothetical protein